MSVLERATELIGRPVVTLDTADDVAEIKDIVFHSGRWDVIGFTLRGRGSLGAPDAGQLALESITAIGQHAVMIASDGVIAQHIGALDRALEEPREVLGDEVITEAGRKIGTVSDLVLQLEPDRVDVAGYEVKTEDGKQVLVPIPDTFGVSGDTLVVPTSVEQYVTHDLTGFGGAVERFRAHLRERGQGQEAHGAPTPEASVAPSAPSSSPASGPGAGSGTRDRPGTGDGLGSDRPPALDGPDRPDTAAPPPGDTLPHEGEAPRQGGPR
jgi:uncharacterized protein YrrD